MQAYSFYKPYGTELEKRSFNFSLRIVNMVGKLPKNTVSSTIGKQIIRSGTSVGANICEAESGLTKNEFTYFMNVARREARETFYWLLLLTDSGEVPLSKTKLLIEETTEIVKILTTIVKNSRKKKGE